MHERKLIFHLTNRGFFSEVTNMINAVIYAAHANWAFSLCSDSFLYSIHKGWTDYFKRFWPESDSSCGRHAVPTETIECIGNKDELFRQIRSFDYGHVNVPALGLYPNNVFANKRKVTQATYRLRRDVEMEIDELIAGLKLPSDYAAAHVRRGDKVGEAPAWTNGKGFTEAKKFHAVEYLRRLNAESENETATLFVCSDSFSAVEEFEEYSNSHAKRLNIHSLVDPSQQGNSTILLRRKFSDTRREVIRLLADMKICAQSSRFVGTYSSNLSRFVPLLHKDPTRCHSMDEDWTYY